MAFLINSDPVYIDYFNYNSQQTGNKGVLCSLISLNRRTGSQVHQNSSLLIGSSQLGRRSYYQSRLLATDSEVFNVPLSNFNTLSVLEPPELEENPQVSSQGIHQGQRPLQIQTGQEDRETTSHGGHRGRRGRGRAKTRSVARVPSPVNVNNSSQVSWGKYAGFFHAYQKIQAGHCQVQDHLRPSMMKTIKRYSMDIM